MAPLAEPPIPPIAIPPLPPLPPLLPLLPIAAILPETQEAPLPLPPYGIKIGDVVPVGTL
ncbi:MAG: hypothetical protein WCC17_17535 [Candidatus Nitrosopolaris sp.]